MEVLNIIDKLARNRVVEDMIKNMNINDYPDDLAQEIYLILLEYDKEKIEEMYNKNQINFFISRIITNQAFSKNSPFYLNYKKWDFNKEELDFDNDADTEGY